MKTIGWVLATVSFALAVLMGCIAISNKQACEAANADLAALKQRSDTTEALLSNVCSENRQLKDKLRDSEFNATFFQKETAGLMKDREHFEKLYWDALDKLKDKKPK